MRCDSFKNGIHAKTMNFLREAGGSFSDLFIDTSQDSTEEQRKARSFFLALPNQDQKLLNNIAMAADALIGGI